MGQIRSELLAQAISRLTQLTPEEQDIAAIEILALICPEEEWILIAASEPYQKCKRRSVRISPKPRWQAFRQGCFEISADARGASDCNRARSSYTAASIRLSE